MAKRRARQAVQLELPLQKRTWGGARAGAGRKPGTGRRNVRHRPRETHALRHPLHVVMRSRFSPLRSPFLFATVRRALARATHARESFRVLHFSVQDDHLHLIVEASTKSDLSRGMQGLAVRLARAINRLTFRRGKLWSDRFFARALETPREVRNALAYVLNNFRKHHAKGAARIDPYSSAPYFSGFRELRGSAPCELPASSTLPLAPLRVAPAKPNEIPISPAKTWLARTGWRRAGTITFSTRPQTL